MLCVVVYTIVKCVHFPQVRSRFEREESVRDSQVNSLHEQASIDELMSGFRQAERLTPGITDKFIAKLRTHIQR